MDFNRPNSPETQYYLDTLYLSARISANEISNSCIPARSQRLVYQQLESNAGSFANWITENEISSDFVEGNDTTDIPKTPESLTAFITENIWCDSPSRASTPEIVDGLTDAISENEISDDCVSASDAPKTLEIAGGLADFISENEISDTCVTASDATDTPETTVSTVACLTESEISDTCVTSSEASNTPVTGDSTVARVSVSVPASNKPSEEDIHRVLNALLDSTDSAETETEDTGILTIAKEVRDIRRNLIDLLESIHSTAMDLDGKDFNAMAIIVRSNQKKGLFPSMMISEIKKSIMGKYEKDISMDDYYQTLEVLSKFSYNVKEYNVVDNLFYPKIPKIMSFLKEEDLLTKEIFLEYMTINKGNDDIRKRIAEFKSIDTPGIVEFMKALQEIGILSEVLLLKYKVLANECVEANLVLGPQISRMKDMMEKLCKIGSEYPDKCSNTMYIKEENLEYFMRCGKHVSLKGSVSPKVKVCTSEHNIPFCGKCGWRTSWLKAFRKRDVYVTEAVTDTKEHTWSIN